MITPNWHHFIVPCEKYRVKKERVLHHATCPVCGRKGVNLYWYNDNWQCNRCVRFDKKLRGGTER